MRRRHLGDRERLGEAAGGLGQHGHEKVIDNVRGEGFVERGVDGQLAEQAGLDHLVRERGEACLRAARELPARDRPADDEPGRSSPA